MVYGMAPDAPLSCEWHLSQREHFDQHLRGHAAVLVWGSEGQADLRSSCRLGNSHKPEAHHWDRHYLQAQLARDWLCPPKAPNTYAQRD